MLFLQMGSQSEPPCLYSSKIYDALHKNKCNRNCMCISLTEFVIIMIVMISDDGKTDIGVHFFYLCVVAEVLLLFYVLRSEFSHFHEAAIEKSTSHIMTLFSFPSSSLLTPAVSC